MKRPIKTMAMRTLGWQMRSVPKGRTKSRTASSQDQEPWTERLKPQHEGGQACHYNPSKRTCMVSEANNTRHDGLESSNF